MNALRLALIQLRVGKNKQENISRALAQVKQAASMGAHAVCLPECFNSPYGTQFFAEYAEAVPHGETCQKMSEAAKENKVWVLAGSIPERGDDGKLYNTHTSFSPDGTLVGIFRKLHLFDIDVPGKITFRESETLSAGRELLSYAMPHPAVNGTVNVGLGICYDVRFPELAQIYSMQRQCHLLVYPGAFNMTTGPAHWEALARARAIDNQCFVALCSPARDTGSGYVAWGHSIVVGPWGDIVSQAAEHEAIIVADIDLQEVAQFRRNIPIREQRRKDIYSLASENSK